MSGSTGVMAVILLEIAVGAAAVLWASRVWGAVRRGFFLLSGVTITACAAGALAITASDVGAGPTTTALAVFTGLCVLWQVAQLIRADGVARGLGMTAAAAGVVALPFFAQLRDGGTPLATVELALGALFLGSTLHGLPLGHWYLVERRLDKRHMVDSAWWYAAGVAAAIGTAALSAANPPPPAGPSFSPFLAVPGFSVLLAGGLVVICAIIAAFVWKLAREGGRSIQAATGYFYLAVIMAVSAEMSAKFRFF